MISPSLAKHKYWTEGFWDYSQVRPKHKNAIRHSGGIIILAKHNIQPGLRLVENSEGFLWIRLEKSFFNLENDLFFRSKCSWLTISRKLYSIKSWELKNPTPWVWLKTYTHYCYFHNEDHKQFYRKTTQSTKSL